MNTGGCKLEYPKLLTTVSLWRFRIRAVTEAIVSKWLFNFTILRHVDQQLIRGGFNKNFFNYIQFCTDKRILERVFNVREIQFCWNVRTFAEQATLRSKLLSKSWHILRSRSKHLCATRCKSETCGILVKSRNVCTHVRLAQECARGTFILLVLTVPSGQQRPSAKTFKCLPILPNVCFPMREQKRF